MNISRNNHYIPQMYLSRWAKGGKVQVYRLLVSHANVPLWNQQSIEHTGSMPNLYVNILKDEEFDDIEHGFDALFESPAKAAFDKICNGEKMTSDDWDKISDYTCAQYVRTPAFYLWVKEWGINHIPEQINELGEKLGKMKEIPMDSGPASPETSLLPIGVRIIDEKPDEEHTYVEIEAISGKGLWLFCIKHVLHKESLLRKYFQDLKWSVVTSPDGEQWPTCDNPVVICNVNDNRIKRASAKSGLAGRMKAIIIPVSPQVVLLAMSTRRYTWRFTADSSFAKDIKKAIINNAMMYVYSIDEDVSVPDIRARIVDEKEFKRLKNDFDNWFVDYKEIEGPLLNRG